MRCRRARRRQSPFRDWFPASSYGTLAVQPHWKPNEVGECRVAQGRARMKRTLLAALAAAAVLCAGSALAQPTVDWEKIQIKTTDLGNNTYMLEGQGGNITVA